MYHLECSKKDCLPISRYIRNINTAAFEMCYANIGPEEFLPLSLSLGRNTSIEKLDLSHNWLGDDGLYYLSQTLFENNNFVEIILVNNKISSKMLEQLCDAVSVSPKLKFLDLSENRLDDSAAPFIADLMLVKNSVAHFGRGLGETECLKVLDISWNNVVCSGKGMKRFAKGLADISVNQDFKNLVDQAFELLPNLKIVYGSRLSLIDQEFFSLKLFAPRDNSPRKWLIALYKLQQKFNRSLMPFLLEADRDNDMKLSRIELTEALEVS
ncbi:unnamed protein product [Rodentolepis nana]|uniref:EF-hand domain-containing protein n=1 Tax=Rodentolepis nana TaxID=102285 RepID=A0A0R3TN13_RODNA|nr:unnamed protein product [Rodentolepis nana]